MSLGNHLGDRQKLLTNSKNGRSGTTSAMLFATRISSLMSIKGSMTFRTNYPLVTEILAFQKSGSASHRHSRSPFRLSYSFRVAFFVCVVFSVQYCFLCLLRHLKGIRFSMGARLQPLDNGKLRTAKMDPLFGTHGRDDMSMEEGGAYDDICSETYLR